MWITLLRHWARYRLLYRILFFSVLALGMYLGMRPGPPPTPFKFNMIDSLYHAGGLFVCTLLSYLAFPRWRWWLRGVLMFSVGVAVEFVQSFHPTRSADIHDIYANSVGVGAGLVLILVWQCIWGRWRGV
ncbi:VanZ like family protein [Pseudomonas saudimassiliensis]|uniref:VanZ like family protein n=1 Tax=Pseudomonas saudimassiliensis TaxID=1461581 RepID=A0A078MG48_9PSED|nr:VanZ family protein [Pseudomonas saudimassiliensis]CEA06293.1 VanZ like family protein [Pseudomonas saudimassiliensis]CEF27718.1 VanZ like family protein [Pseudomonas saudimassiliensis]